MKPTYTRYEITVTPVQKPARRIVVDTVNAVDVYLADELIPITRSVLCGSLRDGLGMAVICFDVHVRVRVLRDQPWSEAAPIQRRDYGAFAETGVPLPALLEAA